MGGEGGEGEEEGEEVSGEAHCRGDFGGGFR